jgi:hypothetical protein
MARNPVFLISRNTCNWHDSGNRIYNPAELVNI